MSFEKNNIICPPTFCPQNKRIKAQVFVGHFSLWTISASSVSPSITQKTSPPTRNGSGANGDVHLAEYFLKRLLISRQNDLRQNVDADGKFRSPKNSPIFGGENVFFWIPWDPKLELPGVNRIHWLGLNGEKNIPKVSRPSKYRDSNHCVYCICSVCE